MYQEVRPFYFIRIPVATSCNYTSVYSQLVAISMYAIFPKIITKNLLFSLSIFILCFFFEPYASFLTHLCMYKFRKVCLDLQIHKGKRSGNRMKGNKQKRTKLGKWLDRNGIEQKELEVAAKVSRSTITRLCNDKNHVPTLTIIQKIMKAIKRFDSKVNVHNFWDM